MLSFSSTLVWVFLYLAIVILAAEILHRREGKDSETPRKIVHIGVGNVILIAWWLKIPLSIILQSSIAASLVCLLSYYLPMIYSLSGVGRKSLGSFFYCVSIGVLCWIFWDSYPYYAVLGVLIMTWGDGLAAIIGKKFGQHKFQSLGMNKSVEGSLTMLAVSFVIALLILSLVFGSIWQIWLISLIVAIVSSILELFSRAGIDNFLVPLGSAYLAYMLCTNIV